MKIKNTFKRNIKK